MRVARDPFQRRSSSLNIWRWGRPYPVEGDVSLGRIGRTGKALGLETGVQCGHHRIHIGWARCAPAAKPTSNALLGDCGRIRDFVVFEYHRAQCQPMGTKRHCRASAT